MISNFTVIYDACVLYPAPLRDLLMRLALTDLYRARWTDMIHDEWTRNVLKQWPDLKAEDLERTRSLMNAHVRDSLVTGFEHLIPSVELPDADDRHVVAAAIHGGASLIVTFNLKDFPPEMRGTIPPRPRRSSNLSARTRRNPHQPARPDAMPLIFNKLLDRSALADCGLSIGRKFGMSRRPPVPHG